MKYTYYKAFVSNKHLLFAEEIRDILDGRGYQLTAAQIHKLMRESNAEPLYYRTRVGLKKVYDIDKVLALLNSAQSH